MAKFYAVREGIKPGIYTNWDDCKAQTQSFKGAKFKSFGTEAEAKQYMNADKTINFKDGKVEVPDGYIEIFVDGSYNEKEDICGYGAVFIENGEIIHNMRGYKHLEQHSRNVTGELVGAMHSINAAYKLKKKGVIVYYDYVGIEAFANGDFTPTIELTKKYAEFTKNIKQHMDLRFVKCNAHTNVEMNELADNLAKSAVGIKVDLPVLPKLEIK